MVGATKPAAGGYGITSLPTTTPTAAPATTAPAAGNPIDQLKSAVEALAQNPIVRALLGQSGFDGLGAQGKGQGLALGHAKQAEKAAGAGEPQTPEQGIQKLVEGLQKFVELLAQLLGKQAGQPAQGGAPAPAEGAGAAGGAGGGQAAEGAGGGQAAEGAGGGAAPAQGAAPTAPPTAPAAAEGAEGPKSPMQALIETLTKLIEKLVEFQKAMQAQQQQQPGAAPGTGAPNGNTGIVPPATNTGVVPPSVPGSTL